MLKKIISLLLGYGIDKELMDKCCSEYIKYITYVQDNIEL